MEIEKYHKLLDERKEKIGKIFEKIGKEANKFNDKVEFTGITINDSSVSNSTYYTFNYQNKEDDCLELNFKVKVSDHDKHFGNEFKFIFEKFTSEEENEYWFETFDFNYWNDKNLIACLKEFLEEEYY